LKEFVRISMLFMIAERYVERVRKKSIFIEGLEIFTKMGL